MTTCSQLKKASKTAKVQIPKPLWHETIGDIDLKNQPDQMIDDIVKHGFKLEYISFDKLFQKMNKAYVNTYKKMVLFNKDADENKICRIIDNWRAGNRLIPPLITVSDGELFPSDGKHRINVAYYSGVPEIMILIPLNQYHDFSSLIK